MLSEELQNEIREKLSADAEACKMMEELDVPGLIAKCKKAGYDLSEADITEIFLETRELSEDELSAVAGGSAGGKCPACSCV